MAYKLKHRRVFSVMINGNEYRLTCYYQSTRTGFRHLCFLTSMCKDGEPSTKDCVAKCVYYNRTWESYPYETVLREAVNKILQERMHYMVSKAMDTVRRIN